MSRPAAVRRLRVAAVSRHSFRTRLTGTRYEREHGAVAVMTAIILSAILIGISALVVDTGVLFTERRQAQNAADAAALSVAQSCAESTTGCTPNVTGNPQQWATDNAKDSMAGMSVTRVCGTDGLGTCPTGDTSKLPDCPTLTTTPAHYAEVHTVATNEVHAFKIRPGDGNDPAACSRVAWGPISSYTGPLPLTFSVCEWQHDVGGDPLNGGGTNYAPSPPYPPYPAPALERIISLADSSHPQDPCTTFNGHDAPGGFGWLNPGPGCQSNITLNSWVQVDTGNNVSTPCKPVIESLVNTVVFIPVFDCMNSTNAWPADPATGCSTGNGTHLWYHLVALAAFYLTGYQLGSIGHVPPSGQSCPGTGGSGRCLFGYFVQDVAPGGDIGGPGTPDLGVKTIQMIG